MLSARRSEMCWRGRAASFSMPFMKQTCRYSFSAMLWHGVHQARIRLQGICGRTAQFSVSKQALVLSRSFATLLAVTCRQCPILRQGKSFMATQVALPELPCQHILESKQSCVCVLPKSFASSSPSRSADAAAECYCAADCTVTVSKMVVTVIMCCRLCTACWKGSCGRSCQWHRAPSQTSQVPWRAIPKMACLPKQAAAAACLL